MSYDGRSNLHRSNSGPGVPNHGGSAEPPHGGGQAPATAVDPRAANAFGQINRQAEQRRLQGVPHQNSFITRAETAIGLLPTSNQMQTAFGPVTVSRGQADQPMVNTQMGNYQNARPPGGRHFTTYQQMANALSPSGGNAPHFALAMVHEMSGMPQPAALLAEHIPPIATPLQNRAMASMVGIIGVAEEQRVDGAREMGLSVMRRVVTGQTTFQRGFGGARPEFPMAGEDGTNHTRQLTGGLAPTSRERVGLSEWAPPGPMRRWSI